jgi:hypothetical protein
MVRKGYKTFLNIINPAVRTNRRKAGVDNHTYSKQDLLPYHKVSDK